MVFKFIGFKRKRNILLCSTHCAFQNFSFSQVSRVIKFCSPFSSISPFDLKLQFHSIISELIIFELKSFILDELKVSLLPCQMVTFQATPLFSLTLMLFHFQSTAPAAIILRFSFLPTKINIGDRLASVPCKHMSRSHSCRHLPIDLGYEQHHFLLTCVFPLEYRLLNCPLVQMSKIF